MSAGDLLGFVVLEPQPFGGYDLMLGTPMFEPDDRESADACLAGERALGEAFVAEVRRPAEEQS